MEKKRRKRSCTPNKRILRDTTVLTVVSEHQEYGHELDWENISLLDSEPCFRKRLMSEMIFIKKQIKTINIQNNIEHLLEAYFLLLNIASCM